MPARRESAPLRPLCLLCPLRLLLLDLRAPHTRTVRPERPFVDGATWTERLAQAFREPSGRRLAFEDAVDGRPPRALPDPPHTPFAHTSHEIGRRPRRERPALRGR